MMTEKRQKISENGENGSGTHVKGEKELELYVHIPFCARKCAYCDFLSAPAGEREIHAYTDALIREIREEGKKYKDCRVSTVFLGGGTPSVLRGEDTARIFHALPAPRKFPFSRMFPPACT